MDVIKKKYHYSAEKRREYQQRYKEKNPNGRAEINARYRKAHPEVYAEAAKRYQAKLKQGLIDLKNLKVEFEEMKSLHSIL